MPVEIKELVIRAVVADDAMPIGKRTEGSGNAAAHEGVDTEELVQECVRQVLRILAKEKER